MHIYIHGHLVMLSCSLYLYIHYTFVNIVVWFLRRESVVLSLCMYICKILVSIVVLFPLCIYKSYILFLRCKSAVLSLSLYIYIL